MSADTKVQQDRPPALSGLTRLASSPAVWYYGFLGLAGVFGLVKALGAAQLLGSEAFGFYAFAMLIASSLDYFLHFGLHRGLEAILPRLYGAGSADEAQHLRNRTAGLILVLAVALLSILLICCLVVPALASMAAVVLLAGGLSVTNLFFGVGCLDLRSRGRTTVSAFLVWLRSLSGITLGLGLAAAFSTAGLLMADAATCLVLFLAEAWFLVPGFRFEFALAGLKRVFTVGLPLILRIAVNDVMINLDRWCVPLVFGFVAFGQYTFAMILASVGMLIYTAIWNDVGPQGTHAFGRTGQIRPFLQVLHRNSAIILAGFVALWLPFNFLTQRFLPDRFPGYRAGIELLPVIYWGVMFQILSQYDWIAMAVQRTSWLLWITLGCTAVTSLCFAAGVTFGWTLAAFAWIYVLGRALTAGGQFLLALWLSRGGSTGP